MEKPSLYLLSILDFDGETILTKLVLSYDNLEDPYFLQFWYLQNYLGIDQELDIYRRVFKKMTLEITGSTETEINLLHSIQTLIY